MTAHCRQPDDPGLGYGRVTFDDRNPERTVARLGCIIVGEIRVNVIGRAGYCRAWWTCHLPDTARQAFPATSVAVAKQKLADKVSEWVEAAGLLGLRA
jgi:hypothetical protein